MTSAWHVSDGCHWTKTCFWPASVRGPVLPERGDEARALSPFGTGDGRGTRRLWFGSGGFLSPPWRPVPRRVPRLFEAGDRGMNRPAARLRAPAALAAVLLLAACATQSSAGVEADNTPDLKQIELETTDYDECLACQ